MGNCGRNFRTDINETIYEALCDMKLWLILSIIIIVKLMLNKLIKTCKKACNVRNETIIPEQ